MFLKISQNSQEPLVAASGAMNIWIKCIPFINNTWKKKKSFWRIQFNKEISGKSSGTYENCLFVEVKYKYVSQLKETYRAKAIASSILFGEDTEDSCYNLSLKELLMDSIITSAALYYGDSILFENDALDGWS